MIEGLRRAREGVLPRVTEQEILANNLSNSLTPGFKRDRVSFEAVLQQAATGGNPTGLPGGNSYENRVVQRPDFTSGVIETTGNPLDLALSGEGFLVVQTPRGDRYARGSSFVRNPGGELATAEGFPVLGDSGPIRVDGRIGVASDGTVSNETGPVGKLRVVQFPPGAELTREGNNLWKSAASPTPATGTSVQQGYLEGSNVNTVSEMVDMLNAFRSYEANMKSGSIQGDSLSTLINNVGRPR